MRGRMAAVALGFASGAALAQHAEDFENGYVSSSAGEILNGQNGYYQPVDGSDSALVFDYAGNALGLPANPGGGDVFVGATGMANNILVRSQKDVPYPDGTVRVGVDICVAFLGQLPAAQNVGSFSTQEFVVPGGDATYIHLSRWTDTATAETWNADMVWFNAANGQLTEAVPDVRFQNLMTNHWYRWTGTFDLVTNRILEVTITDLTSGDTASYLPPDRYLFGGEVGGNPPPDGFRFFVGAAGVAGNTLGFDNLVIEAVGGGCAADLDGDNDADADDFFAYLDAFAAGNVDVCDIDGDGDCDADDFFGYLDLFAQGC